MAEPTPESTEKELNEFLDKYEVFDDILRERSISRNRFLEPRERIALFIIYTIARRDQ